MSLSANALITDPEEVWDYLTAREDDRTKFSLTMEGWINGITRMLEKECNRDLKARDYTDARQDGNGKRWIYLENYPINSITSMSVEDQDGITSYTLDVANDITINNETGKIVLHPSNATAGRFIKGDQNVVTTYNAGFSGDDLEALKNAVKEMILILWQGRGSYPLDLVRSDNIGTGASDTRFDPRRLAHITQRVVWMYRKVEV